METTDFEATVADLLEEANEISEAIAQMQSERLVRYRRLALGGNGGGALGSLAFSGALIGANPQQLELSGMLLATILSFIFGLACVAASTLIELMMGADVLEHAATARRTLQNQMIHRGGESGAGERWFHETFTTMARLKFVQDKAILETSTLHYVHAAMGFLAVGTFLGFVFLFGLAV